ncbi:MAG TPA: glycosyltransferase family 39 protein [Bryobacteraceae bacterium]|nr:glycosyltransferase family 39 protein [Bryobacteraceae bacterium]
MQQVPAWYVGGLRRELIIIALFVLALRLPFLNQAVQGDDVYYLALAEHAQIEPLHPNHTQAPFLGHMVDMRGQPHPPLDAWTLGLLLAIFKDVREVPFHAAYILFSLIAAFSAWSLARRFSPRPLLATLLFLVTPAFVVNGNSLESDIPFVAFWLLAVALYVAAVDQRSRTLLAASCVAMGVAALGAAQAIFLVPILFLYGRKWRTAALATLAAPAVLVGWQVFERLTTGALPAGVLAGYLQSYGFEALVAKLRSAGALTAHLGWLVFPILWIPPLLALPLAIAAAFYDPNPLFWASIAVGVGILIWCARNWRDFLAQWVLIFFAGALAIFFAGSARYLLPIALPVAILASRRIRPRLLAAGVVCGLVLSLLLAAVNYQHWSGYREFAHSLQTEAQTKRLWIDGEWGLQYYLESEGGIPLLAGQMVRPGEVVVISSLAYPTQVRHAGTAAVTIANRTITSPIPLRLIAQGSRSGYSTTSWGLRPFDVSAVPIDEVRAELMVERKPVLTDLLMNAPEAEQQIVSGIYALENSQWRWMGKTAVILLKPPPGPLPVIARFFIPEQAPAREVTLEVDGAIVARQKYSAPGTYTLVSRPIAPTGESVQVTVAVDKTFSIQTDRRELGVILMEVGFKSP